MKKFTSSHANGCGEFIKYGPILPSYIFDQKGRKQQFYIQNGRYEYSSKNSFENRYRS